MVVMNQMNRYNRYNDNGVVGLLVARQKMNIWTDF